MEAGQASQRAFEGVVCILIIQNLGSICSVGHYSSSKSLYLNHV